MKSNWFQILLAVADRPLHGTAIMEEVLERTGGTVKLWPGTLYGALRDLEADGLVVEIDPPAGAPTEGGTRRFYAITDAGTEELAAEAQRLESFVEVARRKRVLDAGGSR